MCDKDRHVVMKITFGAASGGWGSGAAGDGADVAVGNVAVRQRGMGQ
jgi:hypothetical protein